MSTTTGHLTSWALDAAEHGWPVFPLRSGTKVPALHRRDRCPRTGACSSRHAGWEQRATTDPQTIRRCWSCGAYNIGLATGPAGLVVIDCDVPKPGESAPDGWNMLGISCGLDVLTHLAQRARATVPDTYTVTTPSGGTHLYYRAPRGTELRNTQGADGGLGWLIDTRAHGGYVVAPGSVVPPSGYELHDDRDPVDLPGWLVQALTPKPRETNSAPREISSAHRSRYLQSALDRETERVTAALPGARNKSLFIASCALGQLVAGEALTEHDARAALEHASQPHLDANAYSPTQRDATIRSGLTAGASHPRSLNHESQAA
ncbi:hypothetical protein FHX42_004485 [Saccharopolyspora lacisalsi]|uniref:DNA primase/polymerase bifunctional N-terminal domain-containing protein n=1 Tax=Halosaccharopolyspora lacisalsi TaxID=1000566 RepID=A0A839E735_9PSEU|nr:bifunctional DNA primase/polymerase [Halosaccharopolyspora lacisalsi]MBA8827101.1 hypothetical protein [Halosaccharopolyspora lacisalsi]